MAISRESYLTVMEYRKRIESDIWRFFRNDPELARSHPVPHPRKPNKIIFFSGAMAGFFPLIGAGGKIGVKLFFQKIPDLGVRYEAIGATLKQIASPHFISLEYREGPRGGAVWGTEYTPYVKMECVDGVLLKDKVVDLCAGRDVSGLRDLADQWRRIALMMEREQIAHGDIQAENLMVEASGRIRLIDLDTMFVPALRPRGLECVAYGVPAWQHPLKLTNPAHFDERLDRFPALAMYLSLLALGDNPGLLNTRAVGENELLFTKRDFLDPSASPIFQELIRSGDSEVRRISDALAKAALAPYEQVPTFSRVADPDAEANEALASLKNALAAGDHRRVIAAWSPVLESFAPAQLFRPQYHLAQAHLEKLRRFEEAANCDDDAVLSDLWESPPSLEHCPCAATERLAGGTTVAQRAHLAGQRLQGIRAVQNAITAADQQRFETGCFQEPQETAIMAAWTDTRHDLPASKTARELVWPRVEQAQKRFTALRDFEALVGTDDDDLIAKAWPVIAEFAPAKQHQERALDAVDRTEILAQFIAQLRKDPNRDDELWAIWARRSDMDRCRAAARPVPQFGGLVPTQRATLARKRVEAMAELNRVMEARDRPPLDEAGEREILGAWRQREATLGTSSSATALRQRAEAAQKRLKAWELLQQGLAAQNDELIAAAWQTGLMSGFAPAEGFATQGRESLDRMQVLAALNQRHKENPDDEAGFLRIASGRPDLAKCRPFQRPAPELKGGNWPERLELAAKVLSIRAALTRLLAETPPRYDQAAEVWDDAVCRRHALFAPDLARIQEALDLARLLKELRRGLESGDLAAVSTAWRDEFRLLVTTSELGRVRSAMEARFTGPNCLGHAELALEGETLTIRWEWRGSGGFCFVAAGEAAFPEPPASVRPNGFQGGASGGLCTLPFSGNSPHVRIWAMFRFLDEFLLGANPIERRLVTVEYGIIRPLLGGHRLSLRSLSGPLDLPALAVFISENPMWPGTECFQTIAAGRLDQTNLVDLVLPPTVSRAAVLYVGLRPVDRTHEEWLRLRPRAAEAIKIRL